MPRHEPLHNPATGETYTFLRTAEDTGGELLELERRQLPGGDVAVHVHPNQEERFEVVSGRITFRVGRTERTLGPGEVIVVPAGVPHAPRTEGDEESVALIELRPALDMQGFFETFSGIAREGRAFRGGVPKRPLEAAVAGHEFRREIHLARPPLALQLLVRRPAAALGRALGVRARHARHRAPLAAETTHTTA